MLHSQAWLKPLLALTGQFLTRALLATSFGEGYTGLAPVLEF